MTGISASDAFRGRASASKQQARTYPESGSARFWEVRKRGVDHSMYHDINIVTEPNNSILFKIQSIDLVQKHLLSDTRRLQKCHESEEHQLQSARR